MKWCVKKYKKKDLRCKPWFDKPWCNALFSPQDIRIRPVDQTPGQVVNTNAKEPQMAPCKKHPSRETPYRCAKYNEYQCRECLRCKDPKLYCKHRPSCAIYMITERGMDPDA